MAAPIEIWKKASILMDRISKESGLTYIHALQPNQYVEDSKPMSPQEQEIAINPRNIWGQSIRSGYGKMQEAGASLKEEGIAFYDMTRTFNSTLEELYTDDCCHFNERGNEILADALAKIVLAEHRLQRSKPNTKENARD